MARALIGVDFAVEAGRPSVSFEYTTQGALVLVPLLGVAARAEDRGRFLGRLQMAEVVEKVLRERADAAGAAHYDRLAQVREAIAAECRRRFGAGDDVVGGEGA